MSQNLASITYTDEQLAAADAAIEQLETIFANFISLSPEGRRSLKRMGQQSQPFCENTLLMMEQNRHLIPPVFDIAEARRDLLARTQVIPRLQRLKRLVERGSDTEAALGSDVMVLSLAGYGALGVAGVSQGLDGLRSQLSVRFAKKPRKKKPEEGSDKGGGDKSGGGSTT